MINKEINYALMLLLAFLIVLPLANGGGGASVNGCNEGCAALGTGGTDFFCYENYVSMYQQRGNMIIGCDCSQTVGGRVGGINTQFMMAYNRDTSYESYYCDCNGNIRKFYTGDCTTEPTFEKRPEAPIYTMPQDGRKYKCVDPDGIPTCSYERWDPPKWWSLKHATYATPDHRLVCSGLENARWDPPAPLSSVDCGTSGGPAGGGSSGGTSGAGSGGGTLAISSLCGSPGCTIILRGSFIKLNVPPNALEGTGTIVTTNNAFSGAIITITKEDLSLYSNEENNVLVVYRIIPQELAFALPPTITISYDEDSAINEDRLDIYLYDEENSKWIAQNAAVDKEKNELTAHVSLLGVYAVIMQVDTEPPVTKDNYQYNNIWVNKDAVIALSATDDLSGVKETLYCTGNNACVPNISYKEPISITAEGAAYLRYYSTDNAGNKEEIKETIIKVDKTPPELSLALSPSQIWPPDHKEVNVKVNGYAVDSLSNVKTTAFKLVDEYNEVKAVVNNFGDIIKLIAWRDGNDNDGRNYAITVESTDNAGNNAITSASVLVPHDKRK